MQKGSVAEILIDAKRPANLCCWHSPNQLIQVRMKEACPDEYECLFKVRC
jgi:hypothetical protein